MPSHPLGRPSLEGERGLQPQVLGLWFSNVFTFSIKKKWAIALFVSNLNTVGIRVTIGGTPCELNAPFPTDVKIEFQKRPFEVGGVFIFD